jgi:hypothetical protein
MLNRAFATYFHSFDHWMDSRGKISQRQLAEPVHIHDDHESVLRECQALLYPLIDESHRWSDVQSDIPQLLIHWQNLPIPRPRWDQQSGDVPAILHAIELLSLNVRRNQHRQRNLQHLCNILCRDLPGIKKLPDVIHLA